MTCAGAGVMTDCPLYCIISIPYDMSLVARSTHAYTSMSCYILCSMPKCSIMDRGATRAQDWCDSSRVRDDSRCSRNGRVLSPECHCLCPRLVPLMDGHSRLDTSSHVLCIVLFPWHRLVPFVFRDTLEHRTPARFHPQPPLHTVPTRSALNL